LSLQKDIECEWIICEIYGEPAAHFDALSTAQIRVSAERGLSRQRNATYHFLTGDAVGFPDDDCEYLEDTLRVVRRVFEANPGAGVLIGRTVDRDRRSTLTRLPERAGWLNRRHVVVGVSSSAMFFRRSALIKTGAFDETLGVGSGKFESGEDIDIVLRAIGNGIAVYFSPEIRVYHPEPAHTVERWKKYMPGAGRVLRKHRMPGTLAIMLVWKAGAVVKRLLRGNIKLAILHVRSTIWLLKGYYAR
jgi:GT2 family glycosyltransferase